MEKEIEYRDLAGLGHPGYRIGNDGTVWSWKCKDGTKIKRWKQLKPWSIKGGYLMTRFTVEKVKTCRIVHTVILEAFVGPRPNGHEGCHNNNNPEDNRVENLRRDTPKNNCADRAANGFLNKTSRGERHGMAKLTLDQVREIRNLYKTGTFTMKKIGQEYKVNRSTIGDIIANNSWKEPNH